MVECGLEEEDDWVVVKKQKITILIPPPSPLQTQRTSAEKTEPVIVKSSGVPNKRHHRLAKDKHKELSTTSALVNGSEDDIGTTSQAQVPICNPVASPKKFKQPSLTKANDNVKSNVAHRKSIKFPRLLPSGAANVVNRRVRAVNLERKLKELGGLRRWLVSRGLDRFIKVFEREKVGKYELVNLTMSMLKDMGTDAVGPRRKLIHAIDGLCQPDCFKAFQ
ncbi:uncharacterized protein LOC109843311 isoform X2 [Asparagus officinalis]|nr:uncharacterized protein LOC109843311 isoform X2 [Asparagus officinalis]XP_020267836.1 uncharacterized protein LOC109843311 isoform X2 [Asparagus officinalis]